MTSCDLEDNHSLMKLYTQKLETQSFQTIRGFLSCLKNRSANRRKMQFFLSFCYETTAGIVLIHPFCTTARIMI